MDFFTKLFDTSDFPGRWYCGSWTPGLGWLHILSDLGVWSAYVAIPCVLGYFALRKRSVPFRNIFWLFVAFILACGTTHLMEAVIFWWPAYRLAGLIKLFTAVVSWATVVALIPIVPKALSMRTTEELEREIAERKRAEEALRLANARLDLAVRGSNIGIWEIDMPDGVYRNGRVDFTNVWELLGYDRPELPSDFSARMVLVHPDDQQRMEAAIQAYLCGASSELEVEHRTHHRDGSYHWMLTRGVAVRDPAGKPIRMIGSSVDITDHRRAEEALRQSESLLAEAYRVGHVGSWKWYVRAGRLDWSDELYRVFGVDPEHFSPTHESFVASLHPADRARVGELIDAACRGDAVYDCDFRIVRSDGKIRVLYSCGKVIRNEAGEAIEMIGTAQDITERKRVEEALRESEERFRGTFENAAVGIAHKDGDRRWLRVNQKFCDTVGYSREELLERTFQDITWPEDLAAELEQYTPLMRGELPHFSMEKRYVRKDGSLVWVHMTASLQRDAAGRPAYAIAVLQDISERKHLEGELRQAMQTAEAANRAKDEFLANVSHEIRTPMNAILGMTDLALDTPLTEDQRQCLDTVKSAADNLLGIINDLLDFSKITAGKLELDPADFSLRAALGDALRALAMRAHKKGLELVSHVQPDVPDALVGDAGRLRQVLLNLVGNAVKFTEAGEVVVTVSMQNIECRMQNESQEIGSAIPHSAICTLHFEVKDTGVGIPTDKQEKIFRAFEQEDTSTTRKYGGTGLGLTIAARLTALMGGTITVASEPGRGSTFTFTARFGLQPNPPESIVARPPALLRDLPVLIVDDNATNRHILEAWLRAWQMSPTAAADGVTAMDALWHAAAAGRPYGLVLLDAFMPGTDGLMLAGMIRQRAELSAVHIILLTSGERPSDQVRVRELHIDARLLKPVQQEELLQTIYRVMSRADGASPPVRERPAAPAPVVAPRRILVAEDNEFNTRHLERLLVRHGHTVRLANNGREALALLGVAREEKGPSLAPHPSSPAPGFDLLLLDLHMPELDGFQVVQAIREWERTAGGHLPVIALTARSRKEDRDHCLAAGMDDFLAKPVRAPELFAAIDRAAPAPAEKRKEGDEGMNTKEGLLPPSEPGLLDPAALLAACGDDAEGLRGMCDDYRAYAPGRLAEVRDALRDRDAPRLREAAHKLCGLLSAFSTAAGEAASDLEEHAMEGRLDAARPLVDRLVTMARELTRQVNGLSLESLRRQAGG